MCAARFWELAGSKMGELLGIKKKETDEADPSAGAMGEDGEINYKENSQYKNALEQKNVAQVRP